MSRARDAESLDLMNLEPRVLLAADPITPDNPVWAVPTGSVVVDGVLNDQDWASAFQTTRSAFWDSSMSATIRMLWHPAGLFISAEVHDTNLWADGMGNGSGNIWEVESDDSFTVYIDPDNSRDEWFGSGDRALGVNIGNANDPINPTGSDLSVPVQRSKYIKGDGAGGAVGVQPGGAPVPGIVYATTYDGTVNDPSDVDGGWTTEIFISWGALGTIQPINGQTFGMNFDLIFDQDGGQRDFTDNRSGPDRFTKSPFVDDHLLGVHSSYSATQAGLHGPVNYAQVTFIDPTALSRPATIADLSAGTVTGYGARLNFAAPTATTTGLGSVSGYRIRYASKAITSDGDWRGATEFHNRYVPRQAGLGESLRLIGLAPGTTYHVAVRAVDAAGNTGDLSNAVTFTTQSSAIDPSGGLRIVPSPTGRTFVKENGQSHVVVGDHLGVTWNFTRGLFPGDLWDNTNKVYQNFHDQPSFEGPPGPYFDALQARGINTMRVYLDLQTVGFTGNPSPPRGLPWLEWMKGQFNPDMRDFMYNLLDQAQQHDMYLIFVPINGFFWPQSFDTEVAFNTNKGGPVSDLNNFFQTPGTLDQANARIDQLAQWIQASPNAHRLIGWEAFSEWDGNWTHNRASDTPDLIAQEFRTRAKWIDSFAAHIRQADPNRLVLNSLISPDPRGPVNRVTFLSRNFDALTPHFYTNGNSEPINNPSSNKILQAAREQASLTAAWLNYREDRAPFFSGEWGVNTKDFPGGTAVYNGTTWTPQMDQSVYRGVVWSALASGQAGMPLRMSHDELLFNGMILTDAMRDLQQTFARFVTSTSLGIDFADFGFDSLAGRISAQSGTNQVLAWGISDGSQGLAYLLQDLDATQGSIQDGVLVIKGLTRDQVIDVEFWSTDPGTTGPISTVTGRFVGTGELRVDLPAFTQDMAIKFKARTSVGLVEDVASIAANNRLVTFSLDDDAQPVALVMDLGTGNKSTQDISSIAGFAGRAVDMTPYVDRNDVLHLVVTDEQHQLWVFQGDPGTGQWSAQNLTAKIDAPGITGELTVYQPTWGSVQIGALDARGHAVNYWSNDGANWKFSDLTQIIGGPTLSGGLTSFVTSWNALNLVGLNGAGDVVAYWWAPSLGAGNWKVVNMTSAFGGPALSGRLDAFVSAGGAMTIAGLDQAGHVGAYWWQPNFPTDPNRWRVSDLSVAAGAPIFTEGVSLTLSDDPGVNVFAQTASADLYVLRWTVSDPVWRSTNITTTTGGPTVRFPVAGAALGTQMEVHGRRRDGDRGLVGFTFDTTSGVWTADVPAPGGGALGV